MLDKYSLNQFLSTYPLYKKYDVSEHFHNNFQFWHPISFIGLTFNFMCKREKREQTFELIYSSEQTETAFKRPFGMPSTSVSKQYIDADGRLFYSAHFKCMCNSCKAYHIEILLNVYTEKPLIHPHGNTASAVAIESFSGEPSVYVRKIGQWPPVAVKPKKEINDYLTEEDQGHYQNALMCLSQNYGIGAFAYFRRIVEIEIRRIAKDISELSFSGVEQVRQAYLKFERDHQMNSLIDAIDLHLPASLKFDSINPIKVLYAQLSGRLRWSKEAGQWTCLT